MCSKTQCGATPWDASSGRVGGARVLEGRRRKVRDALRGPYGRRHALRCRMGQGCLGRLSAPSISM